MKFLKKLVATATTVLIYSLVVVDCKLAQADVLTQSATQVFDIPEGVSGLTYTQVFKQFDPSIGTLEGVDIEIDLSGKVNPNLRACGSNSTFICSVTLTRTIQVQANGSSVFTSNNFLPGAPTFPATFNDRTTASLDDSNFLGNGNVYFAGDLLAYFVLEIRPPKPEPYPNAITLLTFSPTLTYTYIPAKSVPESSSIWGIAIFGFFCSGLVLKKNRNCYADRSPQQHN